jgi:hypothetical protein
MSQDQKPPEAPIKPEDVLSQIMVLRTKDNRVAVQFPTLPESQTLDAPMAMELLAAGLNTIAQIMRQQAPKKPRIVLAPAIPKEFLTRGKL